MKFNLKSLLLCMIAIFVATAAMANNDSKQLPVDKNVRIGKLKNGLTYYIRHNENPKFLHCAKSGFHSGGRGPARSCTFP